MSPLSSLQPLVTSPLGTDLTSCGSASASDQEDRVPGLNSPGIYNIFKYSNIFNPNILHLKKVYEQNFLKPFYYKYFPLHKYFSGLVSTMSGGGYNLANSSPLNNFASMKTPGYSTSVSSSQERKSSSSSVLKKTSSSMSSSMSGSNNNVTSTEHHSETASASEHFKR